MMTSLARTKLVGKKLAGSWAVEQIGKVDLWKPSGARVAEAQEHWAPLRPTDASNAHWDWNEIAKAADVVLALVTAERETVALFSSARPSVKLEGKEWFRCDYLEVHPTKLSNDLGGLLMSLVAKHAGTLRRDGLLLASTKEATKFYEALNEAADAAVGV